MTSQPVWATQVILNPKQAISAPAGSWCTPHQTIATTNHVQEMRGAVASTLASATNVCACEPIAKHVDEFPLQMARRPGTLCDSKDKHGVPADTCMRVLLPPVGRIVGDAQVEITSPGQRLNLPHAMIVHLCDISRSRDRKPQYNVMLHSHTAADAVWH